MNKHKDKNDETLVALTLLGENAAYEELVLRHERAVMGTALRVTENTYSAEDASQDAFVSAWIHLSSLRDAGSFGAWVCAIAKNCARTLAAEYRAAIPAISLELVDYEHFSADEEWATLCGDGQYAELRDAVDTLSEKLRETVKLHYFEEKSVAEIAEILGVPVGTVKWRLSEGRKQLRKGYGMTEKTYSENESLVVRVMRQVEELKLWRRKFSKKGFAEEYRAALRAVEELDNSKEKSFLLADTLLLGYWWLPGKKDGELLTRIKAAAEEGHNDDVMQTVACLEHIKIKHGQKRIDFIKSMQIPYCREHNFPKTLAYCLFWLGYEYCLIKKEEEGVRCYREILDIIPPTEVYRALALAAIKAETYAIALKKDPSVSYYHPAVSAESYKFVGDKLYFWEQPGYGDCFELNGSEIFWNLAACDGLLLDPAMKPGDKRVSSGDKITFSYLQNDGVCDTPAGHFENCSVFVSEGEAYGRTHTETWLAPGVGIVRQILCDGNEKTEHRLSRYQIKESEGLLPFAIGNRWEYERTAPKEEVTYERAIIFEVVGRNESTVTISNLSYALLRSYPNTWQGNMFEVKRGYCEATADGDGQLIDVTPALLRAEKLATTKREKLHTRIARDVMRRIMETDPVQNPAYTEKGRWIFFGYAKLSPKNGIVTVSEDFRYSFEWKDTKNCWPEGYKALYSFLFQILAVATECLWSDEWVDGYSFEEKRGLRDSITKNFAVTGGERVTTPAGTFENCRHIHFELNDAALDYFSGRSDYWYAPGVGVVRFEHPLWGDTPAIWELTSYEGTGDGYFPLADGMLRRYEPRELADGWHASVEFHLDESDGEFVAFKNAVGTQDRKNYEKTAK